MEDKNIQKYNELEKEFFSSCPNWTYNWHIGADEHCLTWDFDENIYLYGVNGKFVSKHENIYKALDEIVINSKTLRQLLLDTDFNFDYIN